MCKSGSSTGVSGIYYCTGGGGGDDDSEREREKLLEEVTRLCRERHRLARLHRKAELQVRDNLARRRQVRQTAWCSREN